MIIGIVTLIMSLFAGGTIDVFYIDKIEVGIEKQITDKERKKELKGILKDYEKVLGEFNKNRKNRLKELKKNNLNKTTTTEWYEDFFANRLEERIELQTLFIDQRITFQNNIKADEWDKIMKISIDEATNLAEEEQRKEMKKKDKNFFENLDEAIHENIVDESKLSSVLFALKDYKKDYNEIDIAYDKINVNESDFLSDKNATSEQMQKVADDLNKQRIRMYQAYLEFIVTTKENTNTEEWESIIKDFNKVLVLGNEIEN